MAVLNSKKAKLRELRDKLAALEPKTEAQGAKFETEDETDSEEEVEDNDSKENFNSNDKERKEEANIQALFSSASAPLSPKAHDIKMDESREASSSQKASDVKMKNTIEEIKPSPTLDSVVSLLTEPSYTSAPKRRRHL